MSIAIIIAVLIQNIFFPSFANFIGTTFASIVWMLTYHIILQPLNFRRYTFSTLILLGFALTQFCLPVIFILTEFKPLIYNLKFPITVFIHAFLSFLVLLISFSLYKKWWQCIKNLLRKLLSYTPIYATPVSRQLWIMGGFGLIAIFINRVFFNAYSELTSKSELSSFIAGFETYAYLPLLIPLYKIYSKQKRVYSTVSIFIYGFVLIIFGVMANTRGMFMQGLLMVGLVYFLGLMTGRFNYKIFKPKIIVLVAIVGWVITGPLSDLGTAMVVVRGLRSDISTTRLLDETIKTYNDKKALASYKKMAQISVSEWDENYFDNIFLARFCNLKFNDASIEQAYKLKKWPDIRMRKAVSDKLWATFPTPVLKFFDVAIDKESVGKGSFGDFLYNINSKNGVGGFRTGNFVGVGLASFGWWYLLVLFIGSILLFNFADTFVYIDKRRYYTPSILGLMSIGFFFTYFGVSTASESVTTIFTYILRGWIQLVLLYIIVYFFSKKINQVL